ncbi:hypothetical protein [Neoaquamicrobium sediminum]|uniref:Uncharacterized protein n=1 Tax=Neoaquamicrobium sediminum TaxID=1849104 RepID=A0ABV3WUA0_9HYPH
MKTYDAEFEHVTTAATVAIYESSHPIFEGIIREVRELSRKKPEATMSKSKVTLINRVLADLLVILKDEPAGNYLEILDDAALPQVSDAVLVMVQFETALKAFKIRYYRLFDDVRKHYWVTEELLSKFRSKK